MICTSSNKLNDNSLSIYSRQMQMSAQQRMQIQRNNPPPYPNPPPPYPDKVRMKIWWIWWIWLQFFIWNGHVEDNITTLFRQTWKWAVLSMFRILKYDTLDDPMSISEKV